MRTMRRLVVVVMLAVAACTAQNNPDLPKFAAAEAALPPPAPGTARLYFYRLLEPYEVRGGTTLFLNGAATGYLRNGAVTYRDVPAGTYVVAADSPGAFPNQFKTVAVQAGQTWYFQVQSLVSLSCNRPDCRGPVFVVAIVDPARARQEIAPLGFSR